MVIHLDPLALYQGTNQDKWPYGGRSGSSWRVITVRNKPWGRKERLFTDVTNTAFGKEEMVVRL
jgi:hypothetical protein